MVLEAGADAPTGAGYMKYTILQRPPIWQTVFLGFQQYLTMLGSTVLVPFLIIPPMGGDLHDISQAMSTAFFVAGLITLLNVNLADRLPIVHGSSFAFINPLLTLAAYVKANGTFANDQERFLETMNLVQGGIIGAGLVVAGIGITGLISPLIKAISPVTVASNLAVLGLGLYSAGMPSMQACPHLGLTCMALVIIASQYLKNIAIPLPRGMRIKPFELFPVVLSLLVSWLIAYLLTVGGAYKNSDTATRMACETGHTNVLQQAPWFRFPYPGQWGAPKITALSTATMLSGSLTAMVEALGNYYVAADIVGAPVPPPDVIRRAVVWQGLSTAIAGAWGTGSGTTAYSENLGCLQITRVGSRVVIQAAAVWMMLMGLLGKFGGIFASMPSPMLAGLFCVVFGLIIGVGLAQMKYTRQDAPRNAFILGFALYMGLSVPEYIRQATAGLGGRSPIHTPSASFNNVMTALLSTPAAVALALTLVFDNTIPGGTPEERGMHIWQQEGAAVEAWWEDDHMNQVYGLPFDLTRRFQRVVAGPVRRWLRGAVAAPLRRCCPPLGRWLAPAAPPCNGQAALGRTSQTGLLGSEEAVGVGRLQQEAAAQLRQRSMLGTAHDRPKPSGGADAGHSGRGREGGAGFDAAELGLVQVAPKDVL